MTKIKPLQALKLKLPKNFRSMKFVKIRKKMDGFRYSTLI